METEALTNVTYEAEDGEIKDEDEDDELYVPLERPAQSSCAVISQAASGSEDNALDDSSSDSDSSTEKSSSSRLKKKLIPLQPKQSSVVPPKRKNYNIWCTDLQTEVLTNNLVDCIVDQSKERTRDVESYDYRIGLFFNESDKHNKKSHFSESQKAKNTGFAYKRNYDGHYVDEKKKNKVGNSNQKVTKGPTRHILPLTTGVNDAVEDIAKDVANKLYEEKEDLILRALSIIGKEEIISLFNHTRKIEEDGGMMIMNGMRRRTPGGVFFYMLKTSTTLPQEKINLIFVEDRRSTAVEKKKSARDMKKIKTAKLREALKKDDFPTLLSRTELAIKKFKARKSAEESAEVKNPPPSPATDCRENSSDGEEQKDTVEEPAVCSADSRCLTTYGDDDLFGGAEDEMDIV